MDSATFYSWAGAVAIGGVLFMYYTNGTKYLMRSTTSGPSSVLEESQTSAKRRRHEKDTGRRKEDPQRADPAASEEQSSSTQASASTKLGTAGAKKRKAGRETAAKPTVTAAPVAIQVEKDDEADGDDEGRVELDAKEWARQLEARKKGVSLDKPPGPSRAPRQQVSGRSHENAPPPMSTKASTQHTAAGDVSDMLEPSAPGPSVIRITGEQKAKKQQAPKAAPVTETKKQRQNRQKVEEKKLQREEDEKHRKVLEENQRRQAREARGEPAKNGMSTARPPTSSAWAANGQAGKVASGTGIAQVVPTANDTQLLDTFDHDAVSTSSSNDHNTNVTTPATVASVEQDMPSEEAQMDMLNDMNGWVDVSAKAKKGKKKGKTSAPTSPPNEAVATPVSAPAPAPAPAPARNKNPYSAISTNDLVGGSAKTAKSSSKALPSTNGFAALQEATSIKTSAKGHPEDSDWAA